MSKRLLFAVFFASVSLHAAEHILVASSRSNSIEEFDTSGNWIRTFATTGPYAPVALAQSPKTGEIFVTTMWGSGAYAGQLTNRILRYDANGNFNVNWDTFTIECGNCPTTVTQSLLFDSTGDLWVATAYGTDLGGPIFIFEYLAANLNLLNPPAQPNPIQAAMYRGNQMAFNKPGDLCIAGFIDEDVKCFNTSTGAQTVDYYAEIHASSISPTIEPAGLAFDSLNRLYLTSVFAGQVAVEVKPGGPIVLVATLTAPPNELDGNLILRAPSGGLLPLLCPLCGPPPSLYTTSIFPNPGLPAFSTPDPVYQISAAGGKVTTSSLISGAAPPALGNDHIWGAYWMIFTNSPGLFLITP